MSTSCSNSTQRRGGCDPENDNLSFFTNFQIKYSGYLQLPSETHTPSKLPRMPSWARAMKLKRRASLISLPKVEMPDNFADTPLWKLDPDYKAPTEQTTQPDAPTTEQPFETADKSKARTTKSTPEPSRSHNTAEEPTFVVVRRPRASNSVPNSYTADQRPQSSPTEQTGSPSKKPARSESAASDPIAGNKTLPASSSSQNPDSKRTPSNRLRKGLSVILGGPKADSPPLSPEQLLDESKNRDPMPDSWELLEARLNYHLSELDRIKDYIKLQNQVIEEHKQRLHDVMNWASDIPQSHNKLRMMIEDARKARDRYGRFVGYHRVEIERCANKRHEIRDKLGKPPTVPDAFKNLPNEYEWQDLFFP